MKRIVHLFLVLLLAVVACESKAPKLHRDDSIERHEPRQGKANMASQTFTANGSFIPQAGVFTVYVSGCGGGASGASGSGGLTVGASTTQVLGGSGGGGGPWTNMVPISVTPGTQLDITIGTGGAGVSGGASNTGGTNGNDGTNSTVAVHLGATLYVLPGGGKGYAGAAFSPGTTTPYWIRGGTIAGDVPPIIPHAGSGATGNNLMGPVIPLFNGGIGSNDSNLTASSLSAPSAGGSNQQGLPGGAAGASGTNATNLAGSGGAGGGTGGNATVASQAAGGAGGNGIASGTGSTGAAGKRFDGTVNTAALTTNTCSGGAGGGGGGNGSTAGGVGGASAGGDNGVVKFIWFE